MLDETPRDFIGLDKTVFLLGQARWCFTLVRTSSMRLTFGRRKGQEEEKYRPGRIRTACRPCKAENYEVNELAYKYFDTLVLLPPFSVCDFLSSVLPSAPTPPGFIWARNDPFPLAIAKMANMCEFDPDEVNLLKKTEVKNPLSRSLRCTSESVKQI